ncbi:MAG: hypothetical protein U1E22_03435 [Coriobacteriia bacterium]|nr:hypothetical protein [Coriobacteriia bacterium]
MILSVVLSGDYVSQIEKLLDGIRANPRQVRFPDLVRVLEHHGIVIREGKGSHVVAQSEEGLYTIKKPSPGGFVHPKSVKHCLEMFGLWDQ